MSVRCKECGGDTVWDDAAASEICTSCGSLADPNQVILTNQDWRTDLHHDLRDPAAPSILKSRSNYTLAGQGPALRDQKNQLTMGHFIKSLAVSMNAPGLTPRATTLFNQARAIGFFKWGSRARTVAGACLSLALREASRPDSIHDIATLLRCSPHLLSRTFISLTAALKITTLSVDPSVYIATLQSYLTTILEGDNQVSSTEFPASLVKSIRQLSFVAVTNTAQSLGRVLSRNCTSDTTSSKSHAASTACALFMLSLESENRDTLDGLGDLAKCLASRCHIGKGVVMSQYKVILDQVANLIERVPWLEGYRQKKGRAKVSKRLVVARGLKDVIRFNEEILQNVLLPEIRLELSSAEKDDVDDQEQPLDNSEAKCATPHPQPTSGSESRRPSSNDDQPTKRRKIHHSLDEASRFLLNPFNPPVSSSSPSTQRRGIPAQAKPSLSRFPLTSYVLSTSSLSSAVGRKPPTRLQLLAVSRGGSGEHAICDEELFVDGELEGMIRNEEEVETMRRILQFDGDDGESDDDAYSTQEQRPISKGTSNAAKKVQSGSMCGTSRPRKSKIDLEAFTKFMQGGANEDEEVYSDIDAEGETDFDDCDGTNPGFSLLGLDDALGFSEDINVDVPPKGDESAGNEGTITSASASSILSEGEEMVLDEWRPASPSAAVSFEGRYEEEYD
ncbi:hypothetical protein FA13DRAFT_1787687 [Coprinellus micaceus]|uniref:TFIIB-type domain-containing protein n=1 Tax=Coprinellus micaceus TaxID=71717 RepID=A0A4Y7TQJ5_COPMI|nr:hypothetical protein FA13DRAFT_1787687 [Coprinellus micaceus]